MLRGGAAEALDAAMPDAGLPDAARRDAAALIAADSPLTGDWATALLIAHPDTRLLVCDAAAVDLPGPAHLDQLARLRLAAKRRGCGFAVRNAGARLRSLLELTGLAEVLEPEAIRTDFSP